VRNLIACAAMERTRACAVYAALVLTTAMLGVACAAARAEAHLGNISYSDIDVSAQHVLWRFKYAGHLTPGIDVSQKVPPTRAAVLALQGGIERWLGDTIEVAAGDERCKVLVDNVVGPDAQDNLEVQAIWDCPQNPITSLRIVFHAFEGKLADYQNIVTVRYAGKTYSTVFTPGNSRLSLGQDASAAAGGSAPNAGEAASSATARDAAGTADALRRFFTLGVWHIWTGYDHLLFLFAVLLAGGSLGRLLSIVTSFTLAHSITLALAALGLVSLPPAFVEICIALSIVYVATENLFLAGADRRALVTFAFGLVHGFGFAGVLAQSGLSSGGIAVPLLAFNGGVEAGQVVVLALFVPAMRVAMRGKASHPVERVSSALIGLAGSYWAVIRIAAALR